MSDNIPFELQVQIMKRLPIKSLVQFRSVSKTWKSLIDCPHFISGYRSQVQRLLVRYEDEPDFDKKYVSVVDDDTFPRHKASMPLPPWLIDDYEIIGCTCGLLCLYNLFSRGRTKMAILWNVSIRKAIAVVVPIMEDELIRRTRTAVGFGVCRETTDPKIVKIIYSNTSSSRDRESIYRISWQVEVFTLSSGAWRRPHCNLPRKSIIIYGSKVGVAVDGGVLYWLACEHSDSFREYYIIQFDLTNEEFREIKLPYSLVGSKSYQNLSLSKRWETLVVLGRGVEATNICVWTMEDGVFKKLFIINVNRPFASVMGFRKNGEAIIEHREDDHSKLVVYEPYSKHIGSVLIDRVPCAFSMYPYMESLVMLNQPNVGVHNQMECLKFEDDLPLEPNFSC